MSELRSRFPLVDAHAHLHSYDDDEVALFSDIVIFAVSDDYESSKKTIGLAKKFGNVIPLVGVHPWDVKRGSVKEAREVVQLALEEGVPMLGEVGLDRRFKASKFRKQVQVFDVFLEAARSWDLGLNLHAAGAWREVFEAVTRAGVKVAVFHWFSGSLSLLKEIEAQGYYVTINPSLIIRERHAEVARHASLRSILTESDGPYEYRGLKLEPPLVKKCLTRIARVKGLTRKKVARAVAENAARLLDSLPKRGEFGRSISELADAIKLQL